MARSTSRKGYQQMLSALDNRFRVVETRNSRGHTLEVRRIDRNTGRILARKKVSSTPGGCRGMLNEIGDLRRHLGAIIDGRGPAVDPFGHIDPLEPQI